MNRLRSLLEVTGRIVTGARLLRVTVLGRTSMAGEGTDGVLTDALKKVGEGMGIYETKSLRT